MAAFSWQSLDFLVFSASFIENETGAINGLSSFLRPSLRVLTGAELDEDRHPQEVGVDKYIPIYPCVLGGSFVLSPEGPFSRRWAAKRGRERRNDG